MSDRRHPPARRAALAVTLATAAGLLATACREPLRDGVYACNTAGRGADCPDGWWCRPSPAAAGALRCFASGEPGDAGPDDDTGGRLPDGGADPDAGDAATPPVCGNGQVEGAEACDDGNATRGDGCAACAVLPAVVLQSVRPLIDESLDGIDVLDRMRWCDLDDDGAPDNALAAWSDQVTLDSAFNADVSMSAEWRALVLDGLDLASLGPGRDEAVSFSLASVIAGEGPLGGSFGGAGEFVSVDAARGAPPPSVVTSVGPAGAFELHGLAASLVLAAGTEPIRVERLSLRGSLVPNAARDAIASVRADLCGVLPLPSLRTWSGRDSLPLGLALLTGRLGLPELTLDIDLDGDGLEQLVVAEGEVVACVDPVAGRIEGPRCLEDPAMQDGISFMATLSAVPARVLGAGTE